MPEKLKLCQCGAEGFLKYKQGMVAGLVFEKHRVSCSRCDIKTKWEPFMNLAIAAWNKRVEVKE